MSSKEDPIDFRTLHGLPGEGLEALARHLAEMLNLTVTSSGRGADEGRDLFFDETRKGPLGVETVRWLVQCKDNSQSGKSVSEIDVGGILDKVQQHRATGFLLVTTTIPSTGLKKKLDGLDVGNGGSIRTAVWDSADLRKLLNLPEASTIRTTYFPCTANRLLQLTQDDLETLMHGLDSDLYAIQHNLQIVESLISKLSASAEKTKPHIRSCYLILEEIRLRFTTLIPPTQGIDGSEKLKLTLSSLLSVAERSEAFFVTEGAPYLPILLPSETQLLDVPPLRMTEDCLQHVLLNLISNAVRYRKPNEPPSIKISIDILPQEVLLKVEDSEIGIAASEVGNVFQPGYRGPAAQRLSAKGIGLGLAAAREVAKMFGGDLKLQRQENGTCFILVLKRAA